MIFIKLTPRDPVIARDGRPFGLGVGRHAVSVNWPYPSVLAGSLRTLVGKLCGGPFDQATIDRLKEMVIAGPFPMTGGELFLPAPSDILWTEEGDDKAEEFDLNYLVKRPFCLRQDGEGGDLPAGLFPVASSLHAQGGDKRALEIPQLFWSIDRMAEWLSVSDGAGFHPPRCREKNEYTENQRQIMGGLGYLELPSFDRRTHVKIDAQTGAAEEQKLFSTSGLAFDEKVLMAVRIEAEGDCAKALAGLDEYHPLGGERRLLHWARDDTGAGVWSCPDSVKEGLKESTGVRMILASPAIFSNGWRPGWLSDELRGQPPGSTAQLRLAAAIIHPWQPVSGWSIERGREGPKEVKRLVPSGSVYFFTIERGDPKEVAERLWLRSVCDDAQDRRDGFGIAVWGAWDDNAVKGGP